MPASAKRTPSKKASKPKLSELDLVVQGLHPNPHSILGVHEQNGHFVLVVYRPDAASVDLLLGRTRIELNKIHEAGVFSTNLNTEIEAGYTLEVLFPDGHLLEVVDPYPFWPTLGDLDLHLFGEGRHEHLWHHLGAHVRTHQGTRGTAFAVWAPSAKAVRVVGDFNAWDGRVHPMRSMGSSGIWELFIPGVSAGACYKYEIVDAKGRSYLKMDPLAFATEAPPRTAAVVTDSAFEWQDAEWLSARAASDPHNGPLSIYECHLGSWRRSPDNPDSPLGYRDLAHQLADYLSEMGFTHVELLPVSEHPFGGSWGYQVSAYFAPSARFGSPDDFRYLIDHLHQRGIGVIVDWVPAHFPKDDFALAKFDGTALYEYADPLKGEHPDWGTLVFNFGRNEVRNFLIANALYWIEEFHVDGLRVDAVASMLYLDYSRKPGEWAPNVHGGRENLEAVTFVKDLNTVVYGNHPGVLTIAEESTAWPAVSHPIYVGGLGFGFKWNLGWMHDTLGYFSKDPVHRRFHHNNLTFGLLYAFNENFILPISHDEVVHGKGSLLRKMPGDRWQKFANLRALLAWMWAHPGKQMIFMGCEFAQDSEWSHDDSLDWHLLDDPSHGGVAALVMQMNAIYRNTPALWERDFESSGFKWIDTNDTDNNVLSFIRLGDDGSTMACVANLSPLPRQAYRIGLPAPGEWVEVLNTDDQGFAGTGISSGPQVVASPEPWHGMGFSASMTLPPLAVVWLRSPA